MGSKTFCMSHHSECVVPTVKHKGGSVMIRGCMKAKGVTEMMFIDGMNAWINRNSLQSQSTV